MKPRQLSQDLLKNGGPNLEPIQLVPIDLWAKIHRELIEKALQPFNHQSNDDFVESVTNHANASLGKMRDGKSFAIVCKFFNQAAAKNKSISSKNERNVEQQAEMALGLMKNS